MDSDSEKKRKRGCNYTHQEKATLLEILKGHIGVIENKANKAQDVRNKRKAWEAVACEYNAVASSGPRTWAQLRHLYENLKQRTKQKIAAENMQNYDEHEELINMVNSKPANDKEMQWILPMNQLLHMSQLLGNEESSNVNHSPEYMNVEPIITMPSSADQTSQDIEERETKKFRRVRIMPVGKKKVASNKNKCKNLKELYFRTKLRNARLERYYMVKKNELEIKLLKMKINLINI